MTPKHIQEIKERLEKATPKIYREHPKLPHFWDYLIGVDCCDEEPFVLADMNRNMDNWKNDLAFLSNARTDIELLLKEREILVRALEFYDETKNPHGRSHDFDWPNGGRYEDAVYGKTARQAQKEAEEVWK